MKAAIAALVFCMAMLAVINSAAADDPALIRKGAGIAKQECSSCHQINGTSAPGQPKAPAFGEIGNMRSATMLSISVFLRSSHRNKTMPNILLSDEDVTALASYILSLRKQ